MKPRALFNESIFFAGLVILASCLIIPHSGRAQVDAMVGHWEGAYGRMGSIQSMMMDLAVRDGKLEGTYDIPDLSIFGEPIREIGGAFPDITFHVTYGVFRMVVSPEIGEMTGVNAKWNPPVTLHVKRRPKPSGTPLVKEEVRFANGSVSLAGTLVFPASAGPYPVVVVVQGSGSQGREDGFYSYWGDFFARRGVAALIYDKRGVGGSSGDFETATFADLAGDVAAAVDLLQARSDIDPERIGLFGISQGGWIAPLAAARTDDIAYQILLAGPAVTVREQELDRVEYSLRNDGFSAEDIQEAVAYTNQVFEAAYTGQGQAELFARRDGVEASAWAEYVDPIGAAADLKGWQLIRYDPAPVLKQTKIPTLALFGELDTLVPPQENVDRMRAYLTAAGNGDFAIHVIPQVGHSMETYGTLKGGEWNWPESYWVWPRKSPELYQTIAAWLSGHGLK